MTSRPPLRSLLNTVSDLSRSSAVSDNQDMHQLLAPSLPLGANSHRPRLDERVT